MVQTLARCKSCGLPGALSENLDWRSNGTIMVRRLKGVRLTMLDHHTVNDICEGLEDEEPQSLYTQMKGATRYIIGRMFSGLIGKITRYDMVKKRVLEAMEQFALLLGMGRIEVERVIPAQRGTMLLKKPLNLSLVTAGIAGALEELDKCPYSYSHTSLGGDVFRLTLSAADKDHYDRGSFAWLTPRPPGILNAGSLGRCTLCGLPLAIQEYRWDELYGVVEMDSGGLRVGFLPHYVLDVMREMAGHGQGGQKRGLIEEAVFSSTLRRMQAGSIDTYDGGEDLKTLKERGPSNETWDSLRLRGWGVAGDVQMDKQGWRVTVTNPVEVSLLAGWLRALYTVTMEREPRLSVVEEVSQAHYSLH